VHYFDFVVTIPAALS
jgi:hypothetical protein